MSPRSACSAMWKRLSSMMLSLSASQPTVSATGRVSVAIVAIVAHSVENFIIDLLDEIVAALIELVDVPLRRRDLMIVAGACLVLLVPELDVGARELGDERPDRLLSGHAHHRPLHARVRCRAARRSRPSPCPPSPLRRSRVPRLSLIHI